MKAHILVAFLGYALWVTLKHLLERNHSDLSPARALALLSTLQSADIVLPTPEGRELRLRRITEPSPEQKQPLHQLRITLPREGRPRALHNAILVLRGHYSGHSASAVH